MPSSQPLGATDDAEVGDGNGQSRRLRDALFDERSLGTAPDALFELLAEVADEVGTKRKLEAMARGDDPDGDLDSLDVLAVLQKFPALQPSPKRFVEALDPLQPRLYSISSSPRAMPGRVHLTVDTVRYRIGDRERLGVASTFLADGMRPGERLPVYVQRSHGFALPADPAAPIIMIGPGTGVAPFRAFLHERRATGSDRRGVAVLRPSAARLRLFLRGRVRRHAGRARAEPVVARLLPRSGEEDLRPGPHP